MTPEKFWSKVSKSDGCWEWQGGRQQPSGYGRTTANGRQVYAHRCAWTLTNGSIPDGLHVLHHCDNPPCVRPDHLFLGTVADNNADCSAKGRKATGSWVDPEPVAIALRCGLSIARAAEEGGISVRTVYRMFQRGELTRAA